MFHCYMPFEAMGIETNVERQVIAFINPPLVTARATM